MTKQPIFKKKAKIAFGVLAAVFALLTVAAIVGSSIANSYEPFINAFFNINPWEKDTSSEDNTDSTYFASEYLTADGKYDDAAMLVAAKGVSERVATEGIVLLENKTMNSGKKALPLDMSDGSADKNVSLLGISSVDWLYSGYGSGHVDAPNADNLRTSMTNAGFAVNGTLWDLYAGGGYRRTAGQSQISSSPMNNTCNEMPWSKYTNSIQNSFNSYKTAVITISRDGGEGAPWDPDLTNVVNDGLPYNQTHNELPAQFRNNNYLQLTPQEKELFDNVTKLKRDGVFNKVILLLNMSNYIQLDLISTYKDIDAMLLVGMGGTMATQAVANVLSGKDVPSGRLTDTFVYDNWSAPAMMNFVPQQFSNVSQYTSLTALESGAEDDDSYIVRQEGIYVGYRYYETRYEDTVLGQGNASSAAGTYKSTGNWKYTEEVAYPFGYGLTYGDDGKFEYSGFTVDESDDAVKITVTVKNTGTLPAKETVQVYLQKPYTDHDKQYGIEKSSVELVGFEKSELIDGGKTDEITVSVDKLLMRTYDAYDKRTYILEGGNYYFAVGHDAHDALNNILAKKNKTTANGMDYNGDGSMVHSVNIKSDDYVKYSKSDVNPNVSITNRFDEADVKKAECTGNQDVTYLSRNNWKDTYPTAPYSLACTDALASKIKYVYGGSIEDDLSTEMPDLNTISIDQEYLDLLNEGREEDEKQDRLWLINLMDAEYDDSLWDNLLDQLTFKEMCLLILKGGMSTQAIESINMPGTVTRDGPAGLGRMFADKWGMTRQGVNYPSPCLMGSSFNRALVTKLGKLFGTELMHYGVNGIYAPGAGLHRTAYSGRNWEYYSEDGYLSGEMLAAECGGLTSVGCITYAKHIGFNDQEGDRNGGCVWGNEQSFREVYLMAYEKACKLNLTNAVMSSYNRIGGEWAGLHKGLLTDIIHGEWNFNGHVITDASSYRYMQPFSDAIVAGNDLWLGGSDNDVENGLKAQADNALVVNAMRESCHRIMYTVLHSNAMNGITPSTRIIRVTPWWKGALLAIEIVVGIIAGAFVVLFVLSMTLKRKVKEPAESEPVAEGGGEAK